MADFEGQYIQELPETEELNDTDSFINENNTPKTQRTTWGTIWQAIKDKILTWTYEQLTTDNQTLPGGINELKKAVDELNTNLALVYGKGASLKVKEADNLIYGAYEQGIYYYNTQVAGGPPGTTSWGGAMITFRKSKNGNMVKVAFSEDGRMYRLVQDYAGNVLLTWQTVTFS
ncbi:hypothetical protein [Muricomes intestini]|jgi:hypothetical protein|uniref:hypothetical protein n=1 Tax=Muricomes intestini TaxID=1796634 RepID=UPI002FE113AC